MGGRLAQDVLRRHADAGVGECVVKDGSGGAYLLEGRCGAAHSGA